MSPGGKSGCGPRLEKSVGLYGAVALALGIVIGAGMLSLPGLVYTEAGGWAVYAWVLNGILVLPLLFVFASLGRRFPGAGGVSGFVGHAFPMLRPGCAYMLAGAFALGLPGIALTGASYLAGGLDLPDAWRGASTIAAIAAALLVGVAAIAWAGAKVSGGVQNVVVSLLVLCIAAVAAGAAPGWPSIDFGVDDPSWRGVWDGMALAFFAYTGWKMLSFMTEEFENPKRDFPLAIALSFGIVLALYVGCALAVQAYAPLNAEGLQAAPFLFVVQAVVGTGGPVLVVSGLIALAIVTTNLNGAVWAASRLLFDIGRSGWAPTALRLDALHGRASTPRRALLVLAGMFAVALGLHGAGVLSIGDLLRLAGQNFFVLYTLAVLAYIRLAMSFGRRVFGVLALSICITFGSIFGWGLFYAATLFCLPYALRGLTQMPIGANVRDSR